MKKIIILASFTVLALSNELDILISKAHYIGKRVGCIEGKIYFTTPTTTTDVIDMRTKKHIPCKDKRTFNDNKYHPIYDHNIVLLKGSQ